MNQRYTDDDDTSPRRSLKSTKREEIEDDDNLVTIFSVDEHERDLVKFAASNKKSKNDGKQRPMSTKNT